MNISALNANYISHSTEVPLHKINAITEIMFPPENINEKNKQQAYLFVCLYEVIKYQK